MRSRQSYSPGRSRLLHRRHNRPFSRSDFGGGKFYYDVWVNGGLELANEIIKKNEKDIHDAREEARRAEEVAEHERPVGIVFEF
jgi:hypothetical protein